ILLYQSFPDSPVTSSHVAITPVDLLEEYSSRDAPVSLDTTTSPLLESVSPQPDPTSDQ
ncbi:hypothetical protein U1Q18_007415, partial [Sarracenia purpurea var. burkii]